LTIKIEKIKKRQKEMSKQKSKSVDNKLIESKLALLRKQEFIIPAIIIGILLITFALIVSGVVINGTSSYSSTDTNITQKNNGTIAFARLTNGNLGFGKYG